MLLVVLLTLASLFTATVYSNSTQVLLLGGNGFIGSHVTLALLETNKNVNITILSRGSWPFDTERTIKPYVTHIPCDRYQPGGLKSCRELLYTVSHTSFDYVVDFSGYESWVVEDALDLLGGKVGLYIYISSDSVYEVCEVFHSDPSREEDAKRPLDISLRNSLSDADSYGDQKLACEEVLAAQRGNVNPYVVLRLPDVMGERDTTKRWWFYVLWLQLFKIVNHPIPIPSHVANLSTSYVYASDVAVVIKNIIMGEFGKEINGQAFNLGFNEGHTLIEILKDMADILQVNFEFEKTENAVYMLPSVTRGSVNITKARDQLGFRPTEWIKALNSTVYFYRDGLGLYVKEKMAVVEKLLRLVVPQRLRGAVLEELELMVTRDPNRDEL